MPRVPVDGEAQGTCAHGQPHFSLHAAKLPGRRLPLAGRVSHDVLAHGVVANQAADVDADSSLHAVEVVAEGLPVPWDPSLQRRPRDPFNADERLDRRVVVLRPARR